MADSDGTGVLRCSRRCSSDGDHEEHLCVFLSEWSLKVERPGILGALSSCRSRVFFFESTAPVRGRCVFCCSCFDLKLRSPGPRWLPKQHWPRPLQRLPSGSMWQKVITCCLDRWEWRTLRAWRIAYPSQKTWRK